MPNMSLTAVVRTINSHPSSYRKLADDDTPPTRGRGASSYKKLRPEEEEDPEESPVLRRRTASTNLIARQHMSKSRLSVVDGGGKTSWVRKFSIRKSMKKGKSVESLSASTEVNANANVFVIQSTLFDKLIWVGDELLNCVWFLVLLHLWLSPLHQSPHNGCNIHVT